MIFETIVFVVAWVLATKGNYYLTDKERSSEKERWITAIVFGFIWAVGVYVVAFHSDWIKPDQIEEEIKRNLSRADSG